MNISILDPTTGTLRSIPMSAAMQAHWSVPINSADIILKQINDGMYSRWFKGKKDLVCMDFGANVGLVSLYMLPACKRLHCIEPTPKHMQLLTELISPFGTDLDKLHIVAHQQALTGEEGEFVFMTGHSTENKITSAEGYGNHKITVEGKPLNWFIDEVKARIDFCKIDIEGGEMMALAVEQLQLAYGRVKTFFVEVHPAFNGGMDENREELIRRFKFAQYNVETIDFQTIVATA